MTSETGTTKKWFTLLPLHAAFDNQEEVYGWAFSENRATAALPFGHFELQWNEEADGLFVQGELKTSKHVRLHSLGVRYRLNVKNPDNVWVPHLRPKKKQVIGDIVFRSPMLFAGKGENAVALIPDVSNLPDNVMTYLDLINRSDGTCPTFIHGIGAYKTTGHVFFKRAKAKKALPADTTIRFAHFFKTFEHDERSCIEQAASWMWKKFARKAPLLPQVLPYADYEQAAIDRIFAPDMYHSFDYEGKNVGGMITQTVTAKKKPALMDKKAVAGYLKNQRLLIGLMRLIQTTLFTNPVGYRLLTKSIHAGGIKTLPMISFACWFNQVRTSLGAARWAQNAGRDDIAEKASNTIELALSAPDHEGFWPSICLFPDGDVTWKRGTRAFEIIDSFHLPDCAVTGFHLLEWYEAIKPDQRILERCTALGDHFLKFQQDSGAFPAWVDASGKVDPVLKESAGAAAVAMFLARLGKVSGEDRFAQSALRVMDFIKQEVLPKSRWFDYELLFSCAGRFTGENGPDPFTGCNPENTLSMYFAARACLDLYMLKKDVKHLRLGEEILGKLSLYQQVFDNPRLSIDTFGGFGVMNADAELNDARQGLFPPLYFDYYAATNKAEYFERGIAATKAGYTTMLIKGNRQVAPGNFANYRPSDRGAVLENYGHTGRDEMTAGYLSPDWGCGTALYASTDAFARFAQIYVDLKNERAFGIDLCKAMLDRVENQIMYLDVETEQNGPLEIVIDHGSVKSVIVNGQQAKKMQGHENRWLYHASTEE